MKETHNGLVAAIVGVPEAQQSLAGLISGSLTSDRLIQIYRHNFVSRFSDALMASYPQTCRILGEQCFRGLCRAFIQQEPFAEASLVNFGAGFADFMAAHSSMKKHAYGVDLARLEWAMEVAYNHAGDDAVSSRAGGLRDGLQLIASDYALFDLWHFDGSQELDICASAQWVLVYTLGYEVMLSKVSAEHGHYIQALMFADQLVQAEVLAALSAEQKSSLQHIGVLT